MSSSDHPVANPPREPAALDAWLREQLGRQLTLALLVPSSADSAALTTLRVQLALYTEVRLVDIVVEPAATELQLEQRLTLIVGIDPDILLVWTPDLDATTPDTTAPASWPRAVVAACERLGLLDRSYVVLLGPQLTRAAARALGFEDGFSASQIGPDLLATLSREAVARDAYRRRGSSPPCFL